MDDMRVSLVVPGAHKGGTHVIKHYLSQHSQICVHDADEGHFFDNDQVYGMPGIVEIMPLPLMFYRSRFIKLPEHKLMADVSPGYLFNIYAIPRMYYYNSNMRILLFLRNPITRAYSHWNMDRNKNLVHESFEDIIAREWNYYVAWGFYSSQIRVLWSFFPKENIKVYKSDELFFEHKRILNEVAEWLEIDSFPEIEHVELFKGDYKDPVVSLYAREYLGDIFYYEIKQLEKMLDWDCTEWFEC